MNRLGRCRSKPLFSIALCIANWCEYRNLCLNAIFVPGVLNKLADTESRPPLSSGDWMLSHRRSGASSLFGKSKWTFLRRNGTDNSLVSCAGFPTSSLEGGRLQLQLEEPGRFCFPPFNLIQFVLSKLLRGEADAVHATPFWPSQPCFPTVMELSCDAPRVLIPIQTCWPLHCRVNLTLAWINDMKLL